MKLKSVIAVFMLVACIFTFLPTSVSADDETIKTITTGDPSLKAPTKAEIAAAKQNITQPTAAFEEAPSVFAPYATGKLHDSFLQNGEDYLNYIRYVAHLPEIQLADDLNDNAQHGAVVLAALDELTHYPNRPSDMEEAFYQAGYKATTSSNIGYGYTNLQDHLQGCMDDTSSLSNLLCLGHRRWLLSSRLLNVGFGYAKDKHPFTVTKVFDRSGPWIDYDAITWPAGGNMPAEMFNYDVPWSITLNSRFYEADDSDLEIRVINQTTGETWVFDENTAHTPVETDAYCLMENSGYGDGAITLIFRPDISDYFTYRGIYTVEIHDVYDKKSKEEVVLTYDVDFFDTNEHHPLEIKEQPMDQYAERGETATVSITASGWDLKYCWFIKEPGDQEFVPTDATTTKYSLTVTNLTNGTQLYCEVTDSNGVSIRSDVVTIHCTNPVENPGDMDGNERVDNRDVEYLLWYTLFPNDYPLLSFGDFDNNGIVNNKDVEYLLWHTLFPNDYPL